MKCKRKKFEFELKCWNSIYTNRCISLQKDRLQKSPNWRWWMSTGFAFMLARQCWHDIPCHSRSRRGSWETGQHWCPLTWHWCTYFRIHWIHKFHPQTRRFTWQIGNIKFRSLDIFTIHKLSFKWFYRIKLLAAGSKTEQELPWLCRG
jgi:hypothetical protein